jgi:hypothetical protein
MARMAPFGTFADAMNVKSHAKNVKSHAKNAQ